jgi:hypothetical protein
MAGIGSEDGCQSQTLSARQIFKIEHLFLDNASTSIILIGSDSNVCSDGVLGDGTRIRQGNITYLLIGNALFG